MAIYVNGGIWLHKFEAGESYQLPVLVGMKPPCLSRNICLLASTRKGSSHLYNLNLEGLKVGVHSDKTGLVLSQMFKSDAK